MRRWAGGRTPPARHTWPPRYFLHPTTCAFSIQTSPSRMQLVGHLTEAVLDGEALAVTYVAVAGRPIMRSLRVPAARVLLVRPA